MSNVRAAVMERPGRIAVRKFPMPEPEPGAVLMQVRFSGICGTDKHTFRGESKQYAGTEHERDLIYPLICGHENVGRVAALGGTVLDSEGSPLKVGDRIVPAANVPCGRCHFCVNGYPYYFCQHMEDYGNSLHCRPAPHLFGGWS
jgi:D-arabinose 1-dehydrogenase-like Zn-dependent alcohol dehydrogenase